MIKKIVTILLVCIIINLSFVARAEPLLDNREILNAQPVWQRLNFPLQPPPRVASALVLNPANHVALLFGGHNSTAGELNDLWLTNGQSWLPFHTPHAPAPRYNAALAYDEARQQAVLFGGLSDGVRLGDTWIFNGVDWIQRQPKVFPSPRYGASMVYDAQHAVTILLGGLAESTGRFDAASNEMWQWDGETWQQLKPAVLPPARWGAQMVYDRASQNILLFGGSAGGGSLADTWLWDGAAWTEQQPARHPAGRTDFGMAYDETRQQVILFGGQTNFDVDPTATWAWDGQDWTQLAARQAPPVGLAYGAQLVYLPDLQVVMLYNNLRERIPTSDDQFIFDERSETWALAYRNFIFLPIVCD